VTVRLRSLAVPTAVALAMAVAPATPAGADAGSCSIVVPSKVVVDERLELIPMSLGADCGTSYASEVYWGFSHVPWQNFSGYSYYFELMPPEPPAPWAFEKHWDQWFYDDSLIGLYQGTGTGASRADGTPLTQNNPTMTIKYGAQLSQTVVTRTRSQLTLAARATSWSGRTHGWYPRVGATVSLWYRAVGGTTWRWVKNATASSTGRVSLTVTRPPYGDYRLGIKETASVWPVDAPVVRSAR
jgi:hypothetical protein